MTIAFKIYRSLFAIAFCFAAVHARAQAIEISIDKNQILIGERINYELIIKLPSEGYSINFNLPDSISHFETIERGKFDTMNTGGTIQVHQKFIFTSFDSGSWYIPSFPVLLGINNETKNYFTDSILVNVGYAAADSTNELRDIKPILEVKVKDYFWFYVSGIILLVLLIGFLIYSYIKRRKSKPLPVLYAAISPYDEAMGALKELSKYDLQLPAEIKKYHTQLSYIFKRYLSRITDLNLLNKTTGELLIQLQQQQISTEQLTALAQTLRIGDAVKFAKYIPVVSISENCLVEMKMAIEGLAKFKPNKN